MMDKASDLHFDRFKYTFKQLCQPGYSISDDSVLHLLADVIQHSLCDAVSVSGAGLDEFLKEAGRTCDTLEGDVVTFSLQVAGHVGGTELLFGHFIQLLDAYFTNVWDSKKWRDDVSVLTALYTSLAKVARHREGLYWLVHNKKDIVAECFRLLKSGSSIFMSRSVIDLLSGVLTETLKHDDMREFHCVTMETVGRIIRSEMETMSDEHTNRKVPAQVLSLMKLLTSVCMEDTICDEILSNQHLMDDILKAVLVTEGPVADVCLQTISKLTHRRPLEELPQHLQHLMVQLCRKGDVKRAQTLASLCIDLPDDKVSRFGRALLVWPVMFAVGKRGEDDCLVQYEDILTSWMATKTKCTSALCGSLSKLNKTRMEVTEDVINLLQLTVGGQSSDEVGQKVNQEVSGHVDFSIWLVNNSRVQQSCLQYLQDMPASHCHDLSVAAAVIKIMKPSDVDPMIYTSCVRCLLPCVPPILHTSSAAMALELASCLQHHLSAVQWEQRDTTLEFMRDIVEKYKGDIAYAQRASSMIELLTVLDTSYYILCFAIKRNPSIESVQGGGRDEALWQLVPYDYAATPVIVEWMIQHRLHVHIWQCVEDGESYVRASAIMCLSSLLHCPYVWSTCTRTPDSPELIQENVVRQIASILETDTEAFARRAAMSFIVRYHMLKHTGIPETLIAVVEDAGRKAVQDFDWEVKLGALEFYKNIIDTETAIHLRKKADIPCYAKSLYSADGMYDVHDEGNHKRCQKNVFSCVRQLTTVGCIQSLKQALDDFDPKVAEKANDMVRNLHIEVEQYLKDSCPGVCLKDIDWKLCCDTNSTCNSNSNNIHIDGIESNSNTVIPREKETVSDVTKLEATDVLSALVWILEFQPASDTEDVGKENKYRNNPSSLLEDILSYQNHNEEENVVDCY